MVGSAVQALGALPENPTVRVAGRTAHLPGAGPAQAAPAAVTVTVTYTTAGTAMGVTECDDYNNWTAYKRGNSCVNMVAGASYVENVLTYEYTPTCAPNQRLQWTRYISP